MFPNDEEIFIAIVGSTVLFLLLGSIIIFALIRYQNRMKKHNREIDSLKLTFQQEVIKAQFEKEEQTLQHVSQEIHDNIGQILSFVKINMNTMDLTGCSAQLNEKISFTKEMVSKAINELRQLSKSLSNSHLQNQPLSELLQGEMQIINKVGLFKTKLDVKGEEQLFNPQKQLIIFRIAQEALNNIAKHSEAKTIDIKLNYKQRSLYLSISDDGKGIEDYEKETTNKGSGLKNIVFRAKLIESKVEIDTGKNKGTTITMTIPY